MSRYFGIFCFSDFFSEILSGLILTDANIMVFNFCCNQGLTLQPWLIWNSLLKTRLILKSKTCMLLFSCTGIKGVHHYTLTREDCIRHVMALKLLLWLTLKKKIILLQCSKSTTIHAASTYWYLICPSMRQAPCLVLCSLGAHMVKRLTQTPKRLLKMHFSLPHPDLCHWLFMANLY